MGQLINFVTIIFENLKKRELYPYSYSVKVNWSIKEFMYVDEIFENAKREQKEENYANLKKEISGIECAIEKFLNNVLECTASVSERDFNMTSL